MAGVGVALSAGIRESNEEIFQMLRSGAATHNPEDIVRTTQERFLADSVICEKLTCLLDFYKKPTEEAENRLLNGDFLLGGIEKPTMMMKRFVSKLAKKLTLHQQQAFQLLELFFIKQPAVFDKVKYGEGEEIEREFTVLFRPVSQLYYGERLFLIQALTMLISIATSAEESAQAPCLNFYMQRYTRTPLADIAWGQFLDVSKAELPQDINSPEEREEWVLQNLDEQKALLEMLVMLQYDLSHCTPERLLTYLNTFAEQQFRGNYNSLRGETHLSEFQARHEQLVADIGDIGLFLLLSSIRLDAFGDIGYQQTFDKAKNPFNLLFSPEHTPKLLAFFQDIRRKDNVAEHFGPVMLAWICAVQWGLAFPQQSTQLQGLRDTEELQRVVSEFYLLEFLQDATKRAVFTGSSTEFTSVMKYLIKSLFSSAHTQLNIEQAKNYPILVEVICEALSGEGSTVTLQSFWKTDYVNRTGLYHMLQRLSSSFPHEAHDYLKFVKTLVGSSEACYATEVVNLLNSMIWYTTIVNQGDLVPSADRRADDDYYYEASHELRNRTLIIPVRTKAVMLEHVSRDRILAQFSIEYSLWPMIFIIWEMTLDGLRIGQLKPPHEMQVLYEYVDLLATIVLYDASLAERVEALGSREPANHGVGIEYVTREILQPNLTLAEHLLQSFSAFAKLPEVPLATLAKVVEALSAMYVFDLQIQRDNSVARVIREQTLDSYGASPYPFFPSANKIRNAESALGNRRCTLSVLNMVLIVLRDQACLAVFPLNEGNFLREAVKFALNEVCPDCALWESSVEKWQAMSLCLQIVENLLSYFSQLAYPKAEITRTDMQELVVTHLNKIEVLKLLEDVLEVSLKYEDVFENKHWSEAIYRNASADYCNALISSVTRAASVLDKSLELLLYALKSQSQLYTAGRLQLLADLHRSLSAFQSSEDTVGLVPTLMVYVTHTFGVATWDTEQMDDTASVALRALAKVVMVMDLLPQKPSLLQCLGGFCDGLRVKFAANLLSYLGDKVRDFTDNYRLTITSHYFDLLALCVQTQKSFLTSIFSFTDSLTGETLDKVLVNGFIQRVLRLVRSPSPGSVTLMTHSLIFLRQLFEYEALYKSQVAAIKKNQNFLQDWFQASTVLVRSIRTEDSPLAKCAVLTIVKCLLDLLSHEALRPTNDVTSHLIAKFFSADNQHLQDVLRLAGIPIDFEHNLTQLREAEGHLHSLAAPVSLIDFTVFAYPVECWASFFTNSSPYGSNYSMDITSIRMTALSAGMSLATVEAITTAAEEFNMKRAVTDAQYFALESFKKAFAIVSSFGEKGETYSTLPSCTESAYGTFSGLLNCMKDSQEQSVLASLRLLEVIIATIWSDITKETDLALDAVAQCMFQKYQIMTFAYNYALFLWKLTQRWEEEGKTNKARHVPAQKTAETKELQRRLAYLTGKIYYELSDHLTHLTHIDSELLNFLLVFLSFVHQTDTEISAQDSSSSPLILLQELSRFFLIDSEAFALMVSALEQGISIVPDSGYVEVFRMGSVLPVMMEKVTQARCSEPEFLAVLMFFFAYASTRAGAQHLLSEKLLLCLSQAPQLKELKGEYSDNFRNTAHVLWCWVLKLLCLMLDQLKEEAGFVTHSLHFLKAFQGRLEQVLRYNTFQGGKIVEHKQFSAAYLEELEGVTALLERYMRQPRSLKTHNRDQYSQLLRLLAEQTMRIFANGTDLAYVYPPVAEHEQKAASFRPEDAATKEAIFTTSSKAVASEVDRDRFRTVLDHRYLNPDTEEDRKELEHYRPSIFHLHIEEMLVKILVQGLACQYKSYVFERGEVLLFSRETLSILVDVCRFCVHTKQKWKAHVDYRRMLYIKADNLYASVEASIAYGCLNHSFITSESQQLETLHVAMEMAVFLFIKHYEALGLTEGKQEMKRLLGRWVALLNDEMVVKDFVKTGNPILDWAQERFQETAAPGLRREGDYMRMELESPYQGFYSYS